MYAPAEVGDLYVAVEREKQVLGLDVAMDDALAVKVNEAIRHLSDVLAERRGQSAKRPPNE